MSQIIIYNGRGSDKYSVYYTKKVLKTLGWYANLDVICINEIILNNDDFTFNNCFLYVHPGGNAYEQLNAIGMNGSLKIRRYIDNGGKYIGICAGTIIAAKKFYFLGDLVKHENSLCILQSVFGVQNVNKQITLDSNEKAIYYKSPNNINDHKIKIIDSFNKIPYIFIKNNCLFFFIHLEKINPTYFLTIIIDFISN